MKLGEIISKAKVIKCKDKDLPVLSITLRDGFVLQSSHFKKEIASKDKSNYNVVKKNQLVQSIHIDEGGFSVQYIVDEGIVSPAYRIWDVDISLVNPVYLNTFLRSKPSIAYYKSKLRGTIHRRGKIDDSDILGMEIPVPPLAEQERIVTELDLLQGIIDKQKAQLKDLDTLAQSIFYDMFGDPAENEKGLDIRVLSDVCELKAGKSIKASELSDKPNKGLVPCYGGNGLRGYIAKKSHCGCFPIIGRQGALCGNIKLASGEFYATEHAVVCTPTKELDPVFLFYLLTEMNLNKYAKGVAQPGLSVASINPLPVIVPPLSLQQSFATKIEAIERQKASINASIAEAQKLFDYTMDKYFG